MSAKSGNYFALLGDAEPAPVKTEKAAPATTAAPAKQSTGGAPAKAGGAIAAKPGPRKDTRSGHEQTREVKDRERKGPYKGRGRQFDKQSHSGTKQGAKTEKREGAGKANWGTQEDDLVAQTTPVVTAEGEEPVAETAGEAVVREQDEDAKLVSYEEFLKKKTNKDTEIRAAAGRKAGDGVQNKDWEKFVAVNKKDEDAPVFIGAGEEKKEKAAPAQAQAKAGGKKKKAEKVDQSLLAGIRIADKPRDRPERPRGDRPPRAEGGRPPRAEGERPPRAEGERPARPKGDRPPREGGAEGRPPRAQGDRAPRPAGAKGGERPPRAAGPKGAAPKAAAAGAAIKIEDPSAFPALS